MPATHEAGPLAVLSEALDTFQARGQLYDLGGGVDANFDAIASIASLIIGRAITAREVALVLVALKLRRVAVDPTYRDSYVDLVNYVSFAASFAEQPVKTPAKLEAVKT